MTRRRLEFWPTIAVGSALVGACAPPPVPMEVVAASFGVAGMGTDTGNSIRGPSSHLALFGIRSTIGLTTRDGVIPLSFGSDIAGPNRRPPAGFPALLLLPPTD